MSWLRNILGHHSKEWHFDLAQLIAFSGLGVSLCCVTWELGRFAICLAFCGVGVLVAFLRGMWFAETKLWPIRERSVETMTRATFLREQNEQLAARLARTRSGPWA